MEEVKNYKGIVVWFLLVIVFIVMVYLFNKGEEKSARLDTSISNYKINRIIPTYISDEDLAKKYLVNYANLMMYFPDKAFELIDEECLNERFESLDSFKNYLKETFTTNFLRLTVKEYRYGTYGGARAMYVVDADDNEFIFKEKSLMDYTVIIK